MAIYMIHGNIKVTHGLSRMKIASKNTICTSFSNDVGNKLCSNGFSPLSLVEEIKQTVTQQIRETNFVPEHFINLPNVNSSAFVMFILFKLNKIRHQTQIPPSFKNYHFVHTLKRDLQQNSTKNITFLSALAYPKYGITAVIFLAEALLQASIIIKSSIRFSLAGGQVGCTRNTSHPLTLSCN